MIIKTPIKVTAGYTVSAQADLNPVPEALQLDNDLVVLLQPDDQGGDRVFDDLDTAARHVEQCYPDGQLAYSVELTESHDFYEACQVFNEHANKAGEILDILDAYQGEDIWGDVIAQFTVQISPIWGVDAFILESDDQGRKLRFYYAPHLHAWTCVPQSDYPED